MFLTQIFARIVFWGLNYIENNNKFYKRAYKYFSVARLIQEDIIWMNGEAQYFAKVNIETSEKLGKERHLFGSSYTLMVG
jgi:hypothetical protein